MAKKKTATVVGFDGIEVKRLPISFDVMRRLFAHSGNICAFPKCRALMIDDKGKFIGQVCHIKAAMPGGERFDINVTNQQRATADNLMLMCYQHHVETNDVNTFTVAKLRKMKRAHEKIFNDPVQTILRSIQDVTADEYLQLPHNLRVLDDAIWDGLDEEQRAGDLADFEKDARRLAKAPPAVRQFVFDVAARMHRGKGTKVVKEINGNWYVDLRDFYTRHLINGRPMTEQTAVRSARELEQYRLGGFDDHWEDGDKYAIGLYTKGNFCRWPDLVGFAELEGINLAEFYHDLDFRSLGKQVK